jgi:flagellar protein FlgJ
MITGADHVERFLAKMAPTAQAVGRKWNIPPSVIIAQAALETGWGQAVKGNAYFGIKQGASTGDSVTFTTHEVIEGQRVTQVDRFRAYRSLQEATHAYAEFLHDTPRYQEALQDAGDPAKFAEALQQAGYATDPRYAEKLKQIIQRYQLTAYDHSQPATRPSEASELQPRNQPRSGTGWFGGVSMAAKYLTLSHSRHDLYPQSTRAHQTRAGDQALPPPTYTAATGQSGSAGSQGVDPGQPHVQSNSSVQEAPPRLGLPLAEFPRFLWEQIRQFAWASGWDKPQHARRLPDEPHRA